MQSVRISVTVHLQITYESIISTVPIDAAVRYNVSSLLIDDAHISQFAQPLYVVLVIVIDVVDVNSSGRGAQWRSLMCQSPHWQSGAASDLTDAIPTCCLCSQLVHVGCHDLLADGVVCCCLVNEESAVVLFDHGSIVQGQGVWSGWCASASGVWHRFLLHRHEPRGWVACGETPDHLIRLT